MRMAVGDRYQQFGHAEPLDEFSGAAAHRDDRLAARFAEDFDVNPILLEDAQ